MSSDRVENLGAVDQTNPPIRSGREVILDQIVEGLRNQNEALLKKQAELLEKHTELLEKQAELSSDQDQDQGAVETVEVVTIADRLKVIVAFVTVLASLSALASVFYPDFLFRVASDRFSTGMFVLALLSILTGFLLPKKKSVKEDTFFDIDKSFTIKKMNPAYRRLQEEVRVEADSSSEELPTQVINPNSVFERSITQVVDYLGSHIKLADSKASKLLDKGTTYLRRGLYFYIASIVIWQVWGHFVTFNGLIIAGMVSTSIAFIIIEFLAAWFLKQYRSFVDSSMAYMRVQSFFNRYLLLYYAACAFGDGSEKDDIAKNELLKVLAEEIKWPDLKDVNANDFNYMLEAMGSMHTSFEKLKGILQPKVEPKP